MKENKEKARKGRLAAINGLSRLINSATCDDHAICLFFNLSFLFVCLFVVFVVVNLLLCFIAIFSQAIADNEYFLGPSPAEFGKGSRKYSKTS